jgi:hypothetical protein
MKGSAGGLARIDALFGGHGYKVTFENAPVPFGAFPSLHAGCSTMDALFLSHFFPRYRAAYWTYVLVLFWSTMYLSHRESMLSIGMSVLEQFWFTDYLIDLVAGASLSVLTFYLLMNDEMRNMAPPQTSSLLSTPYLAGNGFLNHAKDLERPYGNGFAHGIETEDELEAARGGLLAASSTVALSRRGSKSEHQP